MKLHLRYMHMSDVPEVGMIDRLSFDLAWSIRTYEMEISQSDQSYMVVLEQDQPLALPLWRRWWKRPAWRGQDANTGQIIGFGGLWKIHDEAHISTIAVHPACRGQGYGEILLAGMVGRGMALGAHYNALEVRVSNLRAQSLYRKYEFQVKEVKPRYYRNNDEDAYDMRADYHAPGFAARFAARVSDLHDRFDLTDSYTDCERPYRLAPPPDVDVEDYI
jgi:ribosomal-protein-alanine N-acetyltransferase